MIPEVHVETLPNEPVHMTTDEAVAFAGTLIEARNGPEAAEEILRRVIAMEPEHTLAHEYLAMLLDNRSRMDEAVEAIERALELDPSAATRWNNYGNILVGAGKPTRARKAYQRALELDPEMVEPVANLGCVLRLVGEDEAAEAHLKRAIEIDPKHHQAWFNLAKLHFKRGEREAGIQANLKAVTINPGGVYKNMLGQAFAKLGDIDEAKRVYERWASEEPDNPIPIFQLKALMETTPNRCSDDYVTAIFDNFAGNFESKLKNLEYRAPDLVKAALEAASEAPARQFDVLDAGAGTGWAAPFLRDYARSLTGVDLSAGMLTQAQKLGLYDRLVVGELTSFMQSNPGAYDHIVVCDTFCYFGDLAPAAKAAFDAMRPGGLLVATFEAWDDAEGTGEGFDLQYNGRYTHTAPYVRDIFEGAGFEVVALEGDWLREEFAKKVHGHILTVRRP